MNSPRVLPKEPAEDKINDAMKEIPSKEAIQKALDAAYVAFKTTTSGKNASYIPYLAKVPSQLFGLAAVTAQGDVVVAGDSEYAFAIESISKAFNLAPVIDNIGPTALRTKVGADPTGEAFNSVMAIELHGGKPLSPLVNAGAMATVSLVPGDTPDSIWNHILGNLSAFAGADLTVNEEVYSSESKTNQHNRGIAWLLDSYGYFYNDVNTSVDLYTRMCSVAVTVKQLATMGACYANKGINPLTGKRVVKEENIPAILSEICMEGLYDATGDWMFRAGVPAKSGVGGGLVAVVPGCMALAAFSPPLDPSGNTVKGQLALIQVIQALKLNLFQA